jgi:hypothetical protein
MDAHKTNLFFLPMEKTEFLAGLLFKELTELIAEAKKPDAVINHHRINQVQDLYTQVVRHRNKLIKSKK